MNGLSPKADNVLDRMKAGLLLLGIHDYSSPFRLLPYGGATTWENVEASVVDELVQHGLIAAVDQQGNENEYRPVR